MAELSVLGLGPMGRALAGAFLAGGHHTTVWNRTAASADELVARGAHRASTPVEAIAAAPLVVVCVRGDAVMHEILDPVAGDLAGHTMVNLTSTSAASARDRAAWAEQLGAAPLNGAIMTPTPTIGTAAAMVLYSGSESVYQEQRDTLASLGGQAIYLGADPGRAPAYDTALLDVFWTSTLGIVHGLAMAKAEGISGAELAPFATGVFGLLPEMMTRFAQEADAGRHPGELSTIASTAASLQHITEAATASGIDTGALAASSAVVQRAVAAGHGADGVSRLVELMSAQVHQLGAQARR